MNRIKTSLAVVLFLAVSAATLRAQLIPSGESSSAAFDSLLALSPVQEFDVPVPLPPEDRGDRVTLTGERLFQHLHRLVSPAKLTIPSYKQAKAYMFSTADNTVCGGGRGIMTMYSEVCVIGSGSDGDNYPERGDQNGDGVVDKFVNAEHIWPQGYFNSALPMVSDVHQLASTLYTPNSRRGNVRFGEVSSAVYSTSCGSKLGREGFEPCDPEKGNIARSMLYFVVRYYDRNIRQGMNYNDFWVSRVPMFLEWNRQHPPDDAERRRNDLVYEFQGNRNPFIDNPALADMIGAAVFAAH